MSAKLTVEELGIDVASAPWQCPAPREEGAIEVALVRGPAGLPGDWVLLRVAGDPAGRVLVYDRFEWECFLDGVRKGEFDDALG